MTALARVAPKPWEEAYRLQGRLWRGVRLDAVTGSLMATRSSLRSVPWLELGCGDGKGLVPLAAEVAGPVVGVDAARQALRLARVAARHGTGRAAAPTRDTPDETGIRGEGTTGAPAPRAAGDTMPGGPVARPVQGGRGAAGGETRLVQADGRALPFSAATFGAVRAVHFVGHLLAAERREAVAEVRRVLVAGGTALFVEFGAEDFRATAGAEVERGTMRRGHGVVTHYFAAGALEALVAGAGLVVEDARVERFVVRYDGIDRTRARVVVVARAPGAT